MQAIPLPTIHTSHTITLLCNGAAYFPAVCRAIDQAKQSVYLETYIFVDDASGQLVKGALTRAAARGVKVYVMIDGFGSGLAGRTIVQDLQAAGCVARTYRPQRWWHWKVFLSPILLRRLHRKICVVDENIAFVGGINIIDDHNHAPFQHQNLGPRYDFAVQITGVSVKDIYTAAKVLHRQASQPVYGLKVAWSKHIAFLARDNVFNRRILENMYLKLLASARHEVWLANAYFVPGRRFRKALLACAERGVKVHILLQGVVEYPLQHGATQALYGQLLAAGIHIYEYTASFLHAKVAVIDGSRATVGSSNIDPFSLRLAREANLLIHDQFFAQTLRNELLRASNENAIQVPQQGQRTLVQRTLHWLAYGIVRLGTLLLIGKH